MVESKWFYEEETIQPEIIERKGISVSIRGVHEYPVVDDITIPKHRAIDDYIYDAVRVFYGDTKSALLRNAKEKAIKYKDEYASIRIVPLKVKGMDIIVMYVREIEKPRKSPKYTIREVKSKFSRL